MKKSIKSISFIIYIFIFLYQSFASDLYDKSVAAFRSNNPQEAQRLILEVLEKEGPDASLYNYLGIAYFQTNKIDLAIEAFIKGTTVPFANKALLYYNAANAAFTKNDFNLAERYYTESINDDSRYSASYLNRANTRVKLEKYELALEDYKKYLDIKPEASQKESIESMIILLSGNKAQASSEPAAAE